MYKKFILDDFQKRSQNVGIGNDSPGSNTASSGQAGSSGESGSERHDKSNSNSRMQSPAIDSRHLNTAAQKGESSERARHSFGVKDLMHHRVEQPITKINESVRSKSGELPGCSSSSLTVSTKNKPVEPYRDPDLIKADHQRRQVLHPTGLLPTAPLAPSLTNAALTVPTPHPLLASTPYPFIGLGHPAISGLTPANPSLTPQQLAMLAQFHMAQEMTLAASVQTHNLHLQRLQSLWAQKYPTINVPPGWVLLRYQEELLNDSTNHRQELAEQSRRTQERERIWREQNEREQQERAERERERLAKEKRERERLEKEQTERERLRIEREQQQERERREILHESKAAADAVNQHFEESLNRLVNQHRTTDSSHALLTNQMQNSKTTDPNARNEPSAGRQQTFRDMVRPPTDEKVYYAQPPSTLVSGGGEKVAPLTSASKVHELLIGGHHSSHLHSQKLAALPPEAHAAGREKTAGGLPGSASVIVENRGAKFPMTASVHRPTATVTCPTVSHGNGSHSSPIALPGMESNHGRSKANPMMNFDRSTTSPTVKHKQATEDEAAESSKKVKQEQHSPNAAMSKPTYIDSFRSFVENAVQTAFLQDQDYKKTMKPNISTFAQLHALSTAASEAVSVPKTTSVSSKPQSSVVSVPVFTKPQSSNNDKTPKASSTLTSNITIPTSTSPLVAETMTRNGNGGADTDSDTLSANSPPPQGGQTPSPVPGQGQHPAKFKKALLARYTGPSDGESPESKASSSSSSSAGGTSRETICDNVLKSEKPEEPCVSPKVKEELNSDQVNNKEIKMEEEILEDAESQGKSGAKNKRKMAKDLSAAVKSEPDESSPPKKVKSKGKLKEPPVTCSSEEGTTEDMDVSFVPKLETKAQWDCEKKMKQRESSTSQHPGKGKKGKKSSDKHNTSTSKEENPSHVLANKPLNKESLDELRKSQLPYLQDDSCSEIAPKLSKCRECKMTQVQRDRGMPNIFCRFYAFRRLKFTNKGLVTTAGFSEPSDAEVDDLEIWYPRYPPLEPILSVPIALYLLKNMGGRFCELVEQEKEAMQWVTSDAKQIWKRAVQGVREMCDVCDTTLFNMHWCCTKCGFVVCIDCYRNKAKRTGTNQDKTINRPESSLNSSTRWLPCSANRQQHEPGKLRITQIIPSDVLWALGKMLHDVVNTWEIEADCRCQQGRFLASNTGANGFVNPHLLQAVNQARDSTPPPVTNTSMPPLPEPTYMNGGCALSLLADAAVSQSKQQEEEKAGDKPCSTLRDLLTGKSAVKPKQQQAPRNLEQILEKMVGKTGGIRSLESGNSRTVIFQHFAPRSGGVQMQGRASPIPTYTLQETNVLFPDIPHSWLDFGRLLLLRDPGCAANLNLFQQQWRRGQPVLISNCHKNLQTSLWAPGAFSQEFGQQENDLVDCSRNVVLVGHKMKFFWDGFERVSSRLKDQDGKPMILKLKDWPPSEDFAESMPERFKDLMEALPLPEYTSRTGIYNLASRLPDFFVKPDLGPKMYNAYGSSLEPETGSTNLHLDMSDAANLMVYVSIPMDEREKHEKAALQVMREAGCCPLTIKRATEGDEQPGALWHIFDPQDADKIRDLLNKVASERGEEKELYHDPIHDQGWYIDKELRQRLQQEYGVQAYTFVQFEGDSVFIPAGAPHQVKNLHSCIKAAEDFVSPENINHCFRMTQEFRYLSDTHSNHEDKLQIKNIIYHAVKDAVAVLKKGSSS